MLIFIYVIVYLDILYMNLNRKTKIRYPNILNLIELEHDSDISIEPITEAVMKITSDGIISLFIDGEYYGTHNKSALCLSDHPAEISHGDDTVIILQSKSAEDVEKYIYKTQLTRKMIFDYIKKHDEGQPIEKCGICVTYGKKIQSTSVNDNTDECLTIKGNTDSYIICDNEKFSFDITLSQNIRY